MYVKGPGPGPAGPGPKLVLASRSRGPHGPHGAMGPVGPILGPIWGPCGALAWAHMGPKGRTGPGRINK